MPESGYPASQGTDSMSTLRKRTESNSSLKETLAEAMVKEYADGGTKGVQMAIVGLGRAGHFHLNSLRLLPSHVARLRWVMDVNEEICKKVANEYGCKWTTDLGDILKDPDVAAVIVSSTTDTHYSITRDSLLAKKAVFTEKPISHDPKEVQHIIDLAKSCKLPFVVGFQRRCDVNFREMRDQVMAGAIGKPRVIKCCSRDNPIPPMPYLRTSGGIFHDMLSHDFDMLHFLTGEFPDSMYSVGHCYHPEIAEMDDIDTAVVTLTFPSGLLAVVDTSRMASYGYDQRVEVFGEKGMLRTENEVRTKVELATETGFTTPMAAWSFPQRYKHTYTIEIAEFCNMLTQSPQLVEDDATIERHAVLEKVATGAELSWRLKRKVLVSEVDGLRDQLPHH
eukprot:gnl/TRDRNA2_/TRDRNA2_29778_c0_seq1.p1 gnl/TRDRNA2_/TRDRNA2_29778_c0~~gnl/TRDRNA2_/TRDRNA2_29778_c0_seq1.p1  ORF type:complete len:393 (+),score=50.71 gnl/TRDRNA2_/TRDRNA2_29778_c0_seq1:52-1230(+)